MSTASAPSTCVHNRWGILAAMVIRSGGKGLRRQQQQTRTPGRDDWMASTIMGSVPIASDLLGLSCKPTFIASFFTEPLQHHVTVMISVEEIHHLSRRGRAQEATHTMKGKVTLVVTLVDTWNNLATPKNEQELEYAEWTNE